MSCLDDKSTWVDNSTYLVGDLRLPYIGVAVSVLNLSLVDYKSMDSFLNAIPVMLLLIIEAFPLNNKLGRVLFAIYDSPCDSHWINGVCNFLAHQTTCIEEDPFDPFFLK